MIIFCLDAEENEEDDDEDFPINGESFDSDEDSNSPDKRTLTGSLSFRISTLKDHCVKGLGSEPFKRVAKSWEIIIYFFLGLCIYEGKIYDGRR